MGYLFIALTILLTVYGQLILKWQVARNGVLPLGITGKAQFLLHALTNPWVLSALAAAFAASLCWMLALGVQLFFIGLAALYIGKTYRETKRRPLFSIKNLTNLEASRNGVACRDNEIVPLH